MRRGSFKKDEKKFKVKLYEITPENEWKEKGTGYASVIHVERLQGVSVVVRNKVTHESILESKIHPDIGFERQQDNLIVWYEGRGCGIALKFQHNAGCDEIWVKIYSEQSKEPNPCYNGLSCWSPSQYRQKKNLREITASVKWLSLDRSVDSEEDSFLRTVEEEERSLTVSESEQSLLSCVKTLDSISEGPSSWRWQTSVRYEREDDISTAEREQGSDEKEDGATGGESTMKSLKMIRDGAEGRDRDGVDVVDGHKKKVWKLEGDGTEKVERNPEDIEDRTTKKSFKSIRRFYEDFMSSGTIRRLRK